jgi:ATP-binding cassette subfamily B protein
VKHFANSAALPFLELIAGIGLMIWLNWQLAVVALLVFPITLIGPRLLTPKAVQANYDQKVNEAAILGVVQENVAAQMVVKAFGLQRKAFGWFAFRNRAARHAMADATFLSTMVERTVTVSVLLLHLVVLAIGAYLATIGKITVGTFVTFESAFWEISYNIAHLIHSGGHSGVRRGSPHGRTARRADARRRQAGRARPSAHHPRPHVRSRGLQIRGQRHSGP